jgi:multiple sugar transport system permease protein
MSSDSPIITSKLGERLADSVLLVFALFAAFPFLWIVWTALKPQHLALNPAATNFTPTLESFGLMWDILDVGSTGTRQGAESTVDVVRGGAPVHLYLFNTLVISGAATLLALAVGAFAAYAIARFDTGGTKLRVAFIVPILVPPVAFSISMFFVWDALGFGNSRAAIVISYMTFAIPFAVWFLTTFFQNFPDELEEAAMVDGDTRVSAVINIVIPNMKPAFFATGILIFIYSWNNFIFPFLLTNDESLRTMPVLVSTYVTSSDLLVSPMSAAIIVTVLPVLILAYFLGQFLIEGINSETGID